MKTVEYLEGSTRLFVPSISLERDPPPTAPVFFNPAASLNRDISVAVAAATDCSTFCDSMAGVGARGVRVANEVRRVKGVTLVDVNARALDLGRKSVVLNEIGRKCEFSNSETSSFLYSRYGDGERFDCVDVDPFGTPIGQLQAALCATSDGGMMSVTATDTAVLCGVYPGVARRRYGAAPLNNHFHHETGVRILVGAVARIGAMVDLGVEPVVAHSTRHYARSFVRVRVGASKAERTLGNIGHLAWCQFCGHTSVSMVGHARCQACKKVAKVAGPLWLAGLVENQTVRASAAASEKRKLALAARVLNSLVGIDGFPPWSFSIERVCSAIGVASVSESEVTQRLSEGGFRTMRQPFEKTGVKTDATYKEVEEAVRETARRRERRSPGRVGRAVS